MERIIGLKLEEFDEYVLVSSPQFPLFHLSIGSCDDAELEKCVLPMLKELIEREENCIVADLRLVEEFIQSKLPHHGARFPKIPTHIIAQMKAA